MPEQKVVDRAKEDLREGKSPSTAAGHFAHQEIEQARERKHGARSPQQAIAIGHSRARREGVPLSFPPGAGEAKESTRENAERDYRKGQSGTKKVSKTRSRPRVEAPKKKPRSAASLRPYLSTPKKAAGSR